MRPRRSCKELLDHRLLLRSIEGGVVRQHLRSDVDTVPIDVGDRRLGQVMNERGRVLAKTSGCPAPARSSSGLRPNWQLGIGGQQRFLLLPTHRSSACWLLPLGRRLACGVSAEQTEGGYPQRVRISEVGVGHGHPASELFCRVSVLERLVESPEVAPAVVDLATSVVIRGIRVPVSSDDSLRAE